MTNTTNLTPLLTACPPRPIRQAGDQYAADIINGLAQELASPNSTTDFLATTHLTKATADFLHMATDQVAKGPDSTAPAVYQLYSRYGGGKTHSLLLLAATARYPSLSYWSEQAGLQPISANIVAFDGLQDALDEMQRSAPAKRLMSRHTRELRRKPNQRMLRLLPLQRTTATAPGKRPQVATVTVKKISGTTDNPLNAANRGAYINHVQTLRN